MNIVNKISLIVTGIFCILYFNKKFLPDLLVHDGNFFLCAGKLILFVFLFYAFTKKIICLLNDKNLWQRKYAIDLTFIITFFILLVIPLSKIGNKQNSFAENRKLARYIAFYQNGFFNLNYPQNFENWFSDHFRFREQIIRQRTQLFYNLSSQRHIAKNNYIYKKKRIFNKHRQHRK